jgi:hypothetical protein
MIESFLPDTSEIVLFGPIATVIALSVLARKRPDVEWLQAFSWKDGQSKEQTRQSQRSLSVAAGLEMITFGLGAPAVYYAASVTFFNEASTGAMLLVGAFSIGLISLGARLHAKGTRQKCNVVAFPVRHEADESPTVRKIVNG